MINIVLMRIITYFKVISKCKIKNQMIIFNHVYLQRFFQSSLNYKLDKSINLITHQNMFHNFYSATSFWYLPYNLLIIIYPLMKVINN